MARRKKHGRSSFSSSVYRRHTLLHPMHGFIAIIPLLLLFLSFSLTTALLALAAAEVVVVGLLPHLPLVRSKIDVRLLEKRRLEAAAERAGLLAQMSDSHRRTFVDLERIAASLRARVDWADRADDDLGLKRFLSLYVRLAIAHASAMSALQGCTPSYVDEEDAARFQASSPEGDGAGPEATLRHSASRRIAILRMRGEARLRAREELSAMDLDLATIADTLRWMQERCATAGASVLREELGVAWMDAKRDGDMLRELCCLTGRESLVGEVLDDAGAPPSRSGGNGTRSGGVVRVTDNVLASTRICDEICGRPEATRIACEVEEVDDACETARSSPDLLRMAAMAGTRTG